MGIRTKDEALLSMGFVAERSGLAPSALRFYEDKGLIHSYRSPGGQRRYRREILRRLAVIKVAQSIGIPLADIASALSALPDNRTPTAKDWQKLSVHWHGYLSERIDQLIKLRDRLDGCIGCGCLSMEACPLRNPHDEAAQGGPGARLFD